MREQWFCLMTLLVPLISATITLNFLQTFFLRDTQRWWCSSHGIISLFFLLFYFNSPHKRSVDDIVPEARTSSSSASEMPSSRLHASLISGQARSWFKPQWYFCHSFFCLRYVYKVIVLCFIKKYMHSLHLFSFGELVKKCLRNVPKNEEIAANDILTFLQNSCGGCCDAVGVHCVHTIIL